MVLVEPAPGRCHVSQAAGPVPCTGWFNTMIWVVVGDAETHRARVQSDTHRKGPFMVLF